MGALYREAWSASTVLNSFIPWRLATAFLAIPDNENVYFCDVRRRGGHRATLVRAEKPIAQLNGIRS